MPYIEKWLRDEILSGEMEPQTAGDLTFLLTFLCNRYLRERKNFAGYADVIGALEATKLELYRRRLAPYEDAKLLANGEVYDPA